MDDTKYSVIITETAVRDLHAIDEYWTEPQRTIYVLRFWHSHRDDVSFN